MATKKKPKFKSLIPPEQRKRRGRGPSYRELVDEKLTLTWDEESAKRLQHVRIHHLCMTQSQLASVLGTNKHEVSRIELGKCRTGSFSLRRFRAVFRDATHFIVTGMGASKFPRRTDWNPYISESFLSEKELADFAARVERDLAEVRPEDEENQGDEQS